MQAIHSTGGANTVYLLGGTYNLSSPIQLTSADSNTSIVAAPGQTPVLNGGGADTPLITIYGASGITIQGLSFTGTAGSDADTAPGAILTGDATGIKIVGNTFTNVAKGVIADDGSKGLTVSGNSFTDIQSAAVDLSPNSSDAVVSNNTIVRSGSAFPEGGAIQMYESTGNLISHNSIQNVPRFGIEEQNSTASIQSGGNTIEYNVIEHSGQQTSDVGAIYIFSSGDQAALGDTIRYNKIVDTGPNLSWGIYLDDYTNNAQVYGNFVQGTTDGGVMVHGGSNNDVYNNVLIDNQNYGLQVRQIDREMTGNSIHNNLVAMSSGSQGTLMAADPADPSWFYNNVYVSAAGGAASIGYDGSSFAQWQAAGGDQGTQVTASAGFTDAASGVFSFASGAAALALGIPQLPLSAMGPDGGTVTTPAAPSQPVDPTPTPTTPAPSSPEPPTTVPVGTLVLQLSEDAYRGDAQFIVRVDGQQLAGPTAVTAAHGEDVQTFSYSGDWSAASSHDLEIQFVNDAHSRWGNGDRNLYVDQVTYNGAAQLGATAALTSNGSFHLTLGSDS